MKLCVMGLGYIGLPTAVMFAKHGLEVHGVDVNPEVIKILTNKELHIKEPGLEDMMIEVMDQGKLKFSTEPEEADAFIIAVPTPINEDKTANLNYVRSATEMICPFIREGNLIVLESTVPPKTVENIMVPILERLNYIIGEEIFISHSPERVLPGKLFEELVSNDRIVGGINQKSSQMTVDLYKRFVKGNIHVTDATTAEMVKLMENTYRDVNIAFANELAQIAEDIGFDVWEAIDLANCHPRVNIHKPGPGVGGHCIAVDPWFILERAPQIARMINLARATNDHMPYYVADQVKKLLANIYQPKVAVLGLAFKGNIDDMRESPSIHIIQELKNYCEVSIYDPHVKNPLQGKVDSFEEAVEHADAILILTDHNEFKCLEVKVAAEKMRNKYILDTRNIVDTKEWEYAGFNVYMLGKQYNGSYVDQVGMQIASTKEM